MQNDTPLTRPDIEKLLYAAARAIGSGSVSNSQVLTFENDPEGGRC